MAQSSESRLTESVHNEDDYDAVDGGDTVDGAMLSSPCLQPQSQRVIHINRHQPHRYCANKISTAKYSIYSFLPKFLYEQFRKYANIFFLFIGLMQQIPNVSPTGRFTTAGPLLVILCVSAIKELIEDFKRHRADDEVNKRSVMVLRNGEWVSILWRNVTVGDLIKVTDGQFFPSDLLLLSSSEPQAMCYIETSNLDGETNLKIRQGLPCTATLLTHNDLASLTGYVECELPNRHLYEFVGNIYPNNIRAYPIGPDQLLLRGAKLKNTRWIFGIALYTGHESKLMLNSTSAPLKRSSVDRMVNKQTLMLLGVLLLISLVSAVANEVWTRRIVHTHWYLGLPEHIPTWQFFMNLLTFVILYNNLIPISLQVTLEMVKFIQAIFISWDLEMYDEDSDTCAVARTSNLNEELGQVQYIFSDKTGTLTRNLMEFRKCSIGGISYGDDPGVSERFTDTNLLDNLHNKQNGTADHIREFLTVLAVCHTVVPEQSRTDPSEIYYQASSPDERALVLGASGLGFVFKTRTPDSVVIEVMGVEEKYEILNVLEFTSDRKRMSVIVRTPTGSLKLMTKGADNVIAKRLSKDQPYLDKTMQHLEDFAAIGLRTLCIATADISDQFYDKWKDIYYKASTSLLGRERKLEHAAELIEHNLFLLGATAIEDKLQQGVPESIATLTKAGIRLWVLTGDKQETAVNIGYSCKLLTQNLNIIFLNESSVEKMTELLKRHINETFGDSLKSENPVGLVIDGDSLKFALSFECQQDFLDVAISCRSVICCRVSPLQKAELVELVRNRVKVITLAIGDGANDVGMIQAAHVGVGISGVEGLQAACASDYSIAQFRFLTRLLLVHGAWSYHRLTKLILYSFYKNICLYLIEFWYATVSGFTGQIVFERWSIALYNVLFTAAPPMAIGLFDQYCSAKSMLQFPNLYKASQSSQNFNIKVFWLWCLNAVYHSVLLFWLTVLMLQTDIAFSDGKIGNYLFMGNMVYSYVVVAVCLKAGLEMSSWTVFAHLSIWGSIGLWFLFLIVYPLFWPTIRLGAEMVGMNHYIFSCGLFWMGLILIPTTTLLRDLVWKSLRRMVFRTEREEIRERELAERQPHRVNTCVRRRWKFSMRLAGNQMEEMHDRSQHHGYAFSQEESGIVRQSELIRAYDTTQDKPSGL